MALRVNTVIMNDGGSGFGGSGQAGIGYQKEVIRDTVIPKLKNNYYELGEEMAEGWKNVSNVLGQEWVGEDEVQFERNLAERLRELYKASGLIVVEMISQVNNVATTWMQSQANKAAQLLQKSPSATAAAVTPLYSATEIQNMVVPYEVDSTLLAKERTFSDNQQMGVMSGMGSLSTIRTTIDTYLSGLTSSVNSKFKSQFEAFGFYGGNQKYAIEEYVNQMQELFAKVIRSIDDELATLENFIKSYEVQAQAMSQGISQAYENSGFNGNI